MLLGVVRGRLPLNPSIFVNGGSIWIDDFSSWSEHLKSRTMGQRRLLVKVTFIALVSYLADDLHSISSLFQGMLMTALSSLLRAVTVIEILLVQVWVGKRTCKELSHTIGSSCEDEHVVSTSEIQKEGQSARIDIVVHVQGTGTLFDIQLQLSLF